MHTRERTNTSTDERAHIFTCARQSRFIYEDEACTSIHHDVDRQTDTHTYTCTHAGRGFSVGKWYEFELNERGKGYTYV